MFVGLGVSGVVPILHILITDYDYRQLNDLMGLNWVLFQGALYIFGAFLYAVRTTSPALLRVSIANTECRLVGRNGGLQAPSISGGALTRYSTSALSSPRHRTCMA